MTRSVIWGGCQMAHEMRSGATFRYFVAAATDQGPHRQVNEDAVLVPGMILGGAKKRLWTGPLDQAVSVVAVFDGMGGHGNGRLAAVTACAFLLDKTAKLDQYPGEAWLAETLQQAADHVTDVGGLNSGTRQMGTTVAGLVIDPAAVIVFSVGDARVYVEDDGYVSLMTDDQRLDTKSAVVTQSLGGTGRREHIDFKQIRIPRDRPRRFLVCSDGLSDTLTFAVIAESMTNGQPLDACTALVQAAIAADAADNVTVIVLDS